MLLTPFYDHITLVVKQSRAVIKSLTLAPDHQCADSASTPRHLMKLYHDIEQVV